MRYGTLKVVVVPKAAAARVGGVASAAAFFHSALLAQVVRQPVEVAVAEQWRQLCEDHAGLRLSVFLHDSFLLLFI